MTITRDSLKSSRRSGTFGVSALDDEVRLRQFSAAERIDLMRRFQAAAAIEDDAEQGRSQQEITAKLLQLTMVDEAGQRLYDEAELDALQEELSSEALDQIADKAMVFCGMADESDAPKKSKGTRKGAGSSGSA